MMIILLEFMQRSCSDTMTSRKTVSSTLNLHFQIFIWRKILYLLYHWWWRYHSWKDSWNADSMSISNSWSIKLHSIWLRFAIHLYTMKVSLQTTEHFSSIVHRLSFSDQWSKQTSQSEHQAISLILLFIYAERLI